tara:strand:- start:396 stop:524 length:129 start_codon:yes stop_codon:yes gene_type:complete
MITIFGDKRMNLFEILVLSILAYFVVGSIVGFIYAYYKGFFD